MRHVCFAFVALLLVSLATAQEPLSNDSIIKMVKAGLSEDVILSMVKTQPAKYALNADQLIALKAAGVSDKIVGAMVEKSSGSGAAAGTASGATPTAGTVAAGNPNDPMAPHDSGIYLYAKDRNGEYKLTVLEQATYQGTKAGMLGFVLTSGIKKSKTKAVIPGQHASIRSSESEPVFYFYFEDKAVGLGKGGSSNPNQFALVKLEVTKSSRETVIAEMGLIGGMSTGADEKSMTGFRSERLRPGLYKVVPNKPMEPGEYCFLSSAGASQIFDFAVTPSQ